MRIHLNQNDQGCDIKSSPRVRAPNREDSIFLLVDKNGNPLKNSESEKNLPFRVYYAKKPAFAAIKAYSALARREKLEKSKMNSKELEKIEKYLLKQFPGKDISEYMNVAEKAEKTASAFIYLRKPDNNKIKSYSVGYERILEPNRHEFEKKIVKKAVARPVKET